MSEMEDAAARSNRMQTLPPRRGQVKIWVLKSLIKSATAFASLAASGTGSRRKNGNGNGKEDGASLTHSSPSTTPPIPSGYNSED